LKMIWSTRIFWRASSPKPTTRGDEKLGDTRWLTSVCVLHTQLSLLERKCKGGSSVNGQHGEPGWTQQDPMRTCLKETWEKGFIQNNRDPYKEEIKIPPPHPKKKINYFSHSKDPYFLYWTPGVVTVECHMDPTMNKASTGMKRTVKLLDQICIMYHWCWSRSMWNIQGSTKLSPMLHLTHWILVLV
jgi:hypothetical protein